MVDYFLDGAGCVSFSFISFAAVCDYFEVAAVEEAPSPFFFAVLVEFEEHSWGFLICSEGGWRTQLLRFEVSGLAGVFFDWGVEILFYLFFGDVY